MPLETCRFNTMDGLSLAADCCGDAGGPPVLFLHGGGQTRGSWKASLAMVASLGYRAIAYDARGHGGSDWSPDGNYGLETFARDLAAVVAQFEHRPVVIGASLGGITAMLMAGEAPCPVIRGLVLVDVAPRINPVGVDRILGFMAENPDGFGSVEEAAEAVARYNPGRPKPTTTRGLEASLRRRGDRFYWHWDPAFLDQRREGRMALDDRIVAAAQAIAVPTMLIHAGRSDVVTPAELEHFHKLMPASRYVAVPSAGHMIAGDANDIFNAAIIDFLAALPPEYSEPFQ
jgi:pimeloyl-ACP methyl ester carboxylesterase